MCFFSTETRKLWGFSFYSFEIKPGDLWPTHLTLKTLAVWPIGFWRKNPHGRTGTAREFKRTREPFGGVLFDGWRKNPDFWGFGFGRIKDKALDDFTKLVCIMILVVVSHIFYFHPHLGKIPILTSIFFKGVLKPPTRKKQKFDRDHYSPNSNLLLQGSIFRGYVCFREGKLPHFGGIKSCKCMVILMDVPKIIVHCLGWCPIMTPVWYLNTYPDAPNVWMIYLHEGWVKNSHI